MLVDLREPHLVVGDDGLLRRHALAPFFGDVLGVFVLALHRREGLRAVFERPAHIALFVRGLGELVVELLRVACDRIDPPRGTRKLVFSAAEIFLRRHVGELAFVGGLARALEGGDHLRGARPQRLVRLDLRGDDVREAADDIVQLAHLAVLLEHAGGDRIARAADDATIRVHDGAVETHERNRHRAERDRVSDGFDDDRRAQEGSREGRILIREPNVIGEHADDTLADPPIRRARR